MNAKRKMQNAKRQAFTLVEVIVSMAVASLLVAGMASTIYVTTRANDSTKGPLPGTIEGTKAAQLIAQDVQLAQTFSTRGTKEVQFTVADRDGNGTADTIDYKWSGVSGDPLTVQYNSGTPVNLVSDVRDCQFAYTTQTVAKTTATQTTVNSGETLLASWYLTNWGGTGTANGLNLTTATWGTECFSLNAPSGASNVKVTRVRVWLKKNVLGSGNTTIGVYSAAGGTGPTPSATQIGSTISKANSALGASYAPIDFSFTDVAISSTGTPYNILVKSTASSSSTLQYYTSGTAPADSSIMKYTTLSGASWIPSGADNTYDFPFEVYGSYDAQQTTNTTTNRYFVRGMSIKLRVGGDSNSQVSTSSIVLNSPEVTTP